MCFTVAIIRKGELVTAYEYYKKLSGNYRGQEVLPDIPNHYLVSGFSHPRLPIVKHDGVFLFEWGLIPYWTKDEKGAKGIRDKTLNAVGETAFEKPSFRKSITAQRCLLPVSGFYEWRDVKGVKYPYFVHSTEREYLTLGSIYETWVNKQTGEIHDTFSIVTTPANPLMEKIHNTKKRMPLIIPPEDEMRWINKELDAGQVKGMIRPYPNNRMDAYTISREANFAKNNRDVPGILSKVEYPELIEADKAG
ncbi:MAG TPA: SOS response-associated peptidase [Paludibacter sp.]|nr:SOS response-associated peptidase [Paludibacter sp.]